MNPIKNMNDALSYIEDHLTVEIDLQTVARIACCSEHHFKRMFSFLVGMPLSEYIRLRRLTLAAQDLAGGKAKVIDIAVKYGYESADAFARAFQSLHGVTPTEARREGQTLKAFSRLTFQMATRGGNTMNYRIVEKEAFRMVGIMKQVKLVYSGPNPEIDAMWSSLDEEKIRLLKDLSNMEPRGILSASMNFSEGREEGGTLDYCIGVATSKPCLEPLACLEVPALTWAVFESVGPFPETLQSTWGRIYSEWFPSSEYELAEGPEILWNEGKDTTLSHFRSEIWIPVQRSRKVSL